MGINLWTDFLVYNRDNNKSISNYINTYIKKHIKQTSKTKTDVIFMAHDVVYSPAEIKGGARQIIRASSTTMII